MWKKITSKIENFVINNPDKWEKIETILVVITLLWALLFGVPLSLAKHM